MSRASSGASKTADGALGLALASIASFLRDRGRAWGLQSVYVFSLPEEQEGRTEGPPSTPSVFPALVVRPLKLEPRPAVSQRVTLVVDEMIRVCVTGFSNDRPGVELLGVYDQVVALLELETVEDSAGVGPVVEMVRRTSEFMYGDFLVTFDIEYDCVLQRRLPYGTAPTR